MHWDHVLGFPFFDPVYETSSKIAIDGFPACIKGLKIPFDNRMGDGFWPVKFDDLKAQIRYLDTLSHGPLRIDNTVVDTIPLQHPQGGVGFRFREGKKTLIFLTDNELQEDGWPGRSAKEYAEFCRDADILIHDAQYTPEEWRIRRGWGHSDYVSTLNLAIAARVKRLLLYHHDPSRKDPDLSSIEAHCEELAREKNVDIVVDAAREGSELTV
jgi:ribonuclease BN (tRNA processing enzyme)